MTLAEWLKAQKRGAATDLRRVAGVGWVTVWRARSGKPVSFRVAEAISVATGGAVSIADLCRGAPTRRRRTRAAARPRAAA